MVKTKNPYCFLNGKFIKESDAKISINDIGLHRGFGIFEVLRTYNGKAFLLDNHLKRLVNSSKEIGLKVPFTNKEIAGFIDKLIIKNKHKDSLIKILVTGGESEDGITLGSKSTFVILDKKLKEPGKELYKKGVKLITFEHERIIPSAKTLNYLQLIKSQKNLKKERALTLLYVSKGKVLEGSTCNIFIFKGKKLITPKDGILKGITRELTINLANKVFTVVQKEVKIKDLLSSDEAFITSTTKGIVPLVKVDNYTIGNGKPGKNTEKLIKIFDEYTKEFSRKR